MNQAVYLVITGFAAIALVGCGGTSQDTLRTGSPYIFSPGTPTFDMTAGPTWVDDIRGVGVSITVPNSSLVFVVEGRGYRALYEVSIRLYDRDTEDLRLERAWDETTAVNDYESTQIKQTTLRSYFLEANEGEYLIVVNLRDKNSEKIGTRRYSVRLLPSDSEELSFATLGLEVRQSDGQYRPILPFRLTTDHDSVRIFGTLNTPPSAGEIEIWFRLVRYPSDTSVAAPPYLFSAVIGALNHRGVDYSKGDTTKVLLSTSSVTGRQMKFIIPLDLPVRALYRAHLSITALSSQTKEPIALLEDQAEIVLLSPGFPRPQTIEALIEPLAYIARQEEMDSLRLAPTSVEKKRLFDAFWLSIAQNKAAAAQAIKMYYSRVEEANRFFTTHKEGWRTDRGMLYVVLGPPLSSAVRLQKEIWFYSTTDPDPLNTYYFARLHSGDEESTIQNPILERQSFYEQGWYRAVQRWRLGSVF